MLQLVEQVLSEVYGSGKDEKTGSDDSIDCTLADPSQRPLVENKQMLNGHVGRTDVSEDTSSLDLDKTDLDNDFNETNIVGDHGSADKAVKYTHVVKSASKINTYKNNNNANDDHFAGEEGDARLPASSQELQSARPSVEECGSRTAIGNRLQAKFGCKVPAAAAAATIASSSTNRMSDVGATNCRDFCLSICEDITLPASGPNACHSTVSPIDGPFRPTDYLSTKQASNCSSIDEFSSIDLTGEERDVLAEILSQASNPLQGVASNNSANMHNSKDHHEGRLATNAQYVSAAVASPTPGVATTGADDPAAWSRGHVYAQDGANIEVNFLSQ